MYTLDLGQSVANPTDYVGTAGIALTRYGLDWSGSLPLMIPVRIKQLPIEELELVIAGRRFTVQSRAILIDVLVRGLPQSEVAKQYQVSRGRVNRLLGAFSEIYARKPGRRMGMVTISMEMPEALAKGMQSAMQSYKSCGVDRRKYDALNLMLGAAAEAQAILEPKIS